MLVSALMDASPVMIYFGQELGERGMDAEGYSGCDGRTTIYDYWSVDTVRRWRDGGKFSGKKLTGDEQRLREFYARLLGLRESLPVLRSGRFYDLMYVNSHLHRQYVFTRSLEREVVLVVANFDESDADVCVNLPQEFFQYIKLEGQTDLLATDLLSGEKTQVDFTFTAPLRVKVRGLNGLMLSLKF